jgi:hypothetical protein
MAGLWPAGWKPGERTAGQSVLILTVALPDALQRQACALRRQLAPEAARRAPAHVSLFRHLPGLQQDSLVGDIRTVAASAAPELQPEFQLEPPVRWGGLWVARMRSAGLDALRADLADRWHGLLSPGDLAPPRLHLSLGPGTQPPPPLPGGPWRAPGLLLWQHSGPIGGPAGAGGRGKPMGQDERDGAFWTPLVACAFRR